MKNVRGIDTCTCTHCHDRVALAAGTNRHVKSADPQPFTGLIPCRSHEIECVCGAYVPEFDPPVGIAVTVTAVPARTVCDGDASKFPHRPKQFGAFNH